MPSLAVGLGQPPVAETELGGYPRGSGSAIAQLLAKLLDEDADVVRLVGVARPPHAPEEPAVREQLARAQGELGLRSLAQVDPSRGELDPQQDVRRAISARIAYLAMLRRC